MHHRTCHFFSLLFLAITFSSCALFRANSPDRTYLFLNGMQPEGTPSSLFKKKLTRKLSMAGGFYEVSAYPIVEDYLLAKAKEQSSLRGLTPHQHQLIFNQMKEKYINEKLCFEVSYQALRFKKVSHLENWKTFYVSPSGEASPLKWQQDDLDKEPVRGKVRRSGDDLEAWSGTGTACTSITPNLANGFALKVIPDYVQFPFDSSAELVWEFPEMEMQQGRKVWKEEKKKSFKGYRGW